MNGRDELAGRILRGLLKSAARAQGIAAALPPRAACKAHARLVPARRRVYWHGGELSRCVLCGRPTSAKHGAVYFEGVIFSGEVFR